MTDFNVATQNLVVIDDLLRECQMAEWLIYSLKVVTT